MTGHVASGGPSDRRALVAVAVQFFVNGSVYGAVVPRLPEIRERVGVSIGAFGAVLTVGALAGLLGSLVAGRVIARAGTKRVIVVGSVLSIGALPVIGVSTEPLVLVVGLVGVLLFDVFIDVAMNVQGSEISARRHTPVMNRLHGLWSLGSVVGGVATAMVIRAGVSVPIQMTVVAVVLITAVLVMSPGLLPVDRAHEHVSSDDARVETVPSRRRATARMRPGRAAWVLGPAGAAAMTMEVTGSDWAAFRLDVDLSASGAVAAAGFVAFTSGMMVGRFGGDALLVRIGQPRLMLLAASLGGVGLAVAALFPLQAVVLAGFAVAGLGVSVLFPQLYDAAARAPGPPGSGFTAMLIGQRTAALATPAAIGALANTNAFGVGGAMALVAVPMSLVAVGLAVDGMLRAR